MVLFFIRIRRHRIVTSLRRFPRKGLRISRSYVPKKMYKQILNEMARISDDNLYPLPTDTKQTGWGYDYGKPC